MYTELYYSFSVEGKGSLEHTTVTLYAQTRMFLIMVSCIWCIGGSNKEAVDRVQMKIPMQRMGTRTDVAESCLFLASPLSSYITGAVLVVDGGAWMTSGMCMAEMQDTLASKLWTVPKCTIFFLFEMVI